MIVYLDSSVVLRPLFRQPASLENWGEWTAAYASELLGLECRRAIDRLRLAAVYNDEQVAQAMEALAEIEKTIKRIRLTRTILGRAAGSMPTAVRTLDAIHLASALVVRDRDSLELVFATHDLRQAVAARALGFACIGV